MKESEKHSRQRYVEFLKEGMTESPSPSFLGNTMKAVRNQPAFAARPASRISTTAGWMMAGFFLIAAAWMSLTLPSAEAVTSGLTGWLGKWLGFALNAAGPAFSQKWWALLLPVIAASCLLFFAERIMTSRARTGSFSG